MSKSFELYHPNTNNSTITIGTNGLKIIYCDNAGRPQAPVYILFDKIQMVSEITTWTQLNCMSFKIKCSTLETPLKVNTYEIKMNKDINEVYKLINDGYKSACSKKDKKLDI
jgi:hypothetical protein